MIKSFKLKHTFKNRPNTQMRTSQEKTIDTESINPLDSGWMTIRQNKARKFVKESLSKQFILQKIANWVKVSKVKTIIFHLKVIFG